MLKEFLEKDIEERKKRQKIFNRLLNISYWGAGFLLMVCIFNLNLHNNSIYVSSINIITTFLITFFGFYVPKCMDVIHEESNRIFEDEKEIIILKENKSKSRLRNKQLPKRHKRRCY